MKRKKYPPIESVAHGAWCTEGLKARGFDHGYIEPIKAGACSGRNSDGKWSNCDAYWINLYHRSATELEMALDHYLEQHNAREYYDNHKAAYQRTVIEHGK